MKNLLIFLIAPFLTGADLACSDAIAFDTVNFPCGDVSIGHVVGIAIKKPAGAAITAVGTAPTPTEVAAAMVLTTAAKVVVINPISDAVLNTESMEIQNPYDLAEQVNQKVTVTGVLRYLDADTLDKARQLMAIHRQFDIYLITSNGYWLGAKAGFRGSVIMNSFPSKEFGAATKAGIPVKAEFYIDNSVAFVLSAKNTAYLDLQNA